MTKKRQNTSLPNRHVLIVGASGSGKSSYIRKEVNFKQNRCLAWDPEEDFPLPRVRSIEAFAKLAKKSGFGRIRCAVTMAPTQENFEKFCAIAFALGHAAAPMDVIAGEIASVTTVSKAPLNWGNLCRLGRKYGIRILAETQRPQEADKTILNQANFTWCGALKSAATYKYMAGEMDLTVQQLKELENIDRVQVQYWIRQGTRPATKETIRFK